MILRPDPVILRAPSQMEYAIRHMVVFNSKAYANICTTYHGSTFHRLLLFADQVSTQNAKMSKNGGQKHENMSKYEVVMIVYLYAHP